MVGATLTIALTLVIFGSAYVMLDNVDRATRRLQSRYRMDIFFDELLSDQEAFTVYGQLRLLEGLQSTEFVNKNRAAEICRELVGLDPVDFLGYNPLPAGARVMVAPEHRTARRMELLTGRIEALDGVSDVFYPGELVRIMERFLQIAVYSGLIIGFFVLLGAIFLVSNTIKLSIYAKREAIDILHLMGATRRFIRFPFLIEGTLQGIIGSILALSVVVGLLDLVNYILEQFVLYRVIQPPFLSSGMVISGIILGLIGSSRSIRKFLHPRSNGVK